MKRIATIQDISCFGKCSLTVALPIISAMEIECCIVPTAVLSTHTGGFKNFTFCNLQSEILPIGEHWKSEGISLDTIYTGYLGSEEQIDLVKKFIEITRNENTLIFVDPAMADYGKLYTGFDAHFPSKMLELCKLADVVCPNITEASMLLGVDYKEEGDYTEEYIKDIVDRFVALGIQNVVITGVKYGDGKHGALAYSAEAGRYEYIYSSDLACRLHGTGDVFSSVLCGAITKGGDLYSATRAAVDFTVACIERTLPDIENHPYGVKFEECLRLLAK